MVHTSPGVSISEAASCCPHHVEPPTHYGSNGAAECGAERAKLTLDVDKVTCRTCRGWLPIVAPARAVSR